MEIYNKTSIPLPEASYVPFLSRTPLHLLHLLLSKAFNPLLMIQGHNLNIGYCHVLL